MPTKLNKKLFINKSKQVHGDKYDYSKVEYINAYTKVCIICPEHGEFWQTPASHMKGYGCLRCGQIERKKKLVEINQKKYNTDTFIKDAIKVHGYKFDYSKVEYVNATTKVCIICPEHGEFWQTPNMHLNASQGCPKCAKNHSITQEEFIKRAKEKHGDKYDYSKVNYTGSHNKVTIICPIHGEFEQVAKEHLKYGCLKCSQQLLGNRTRKTKEYFIQKAKETHGEIYDYSKVEYKGTEIPVCIICPDHGEFWQTPHTHLGGHGCPMCSNEKNINEQKCFNEISKYLPYEKIVTEKTFPWLKCKKKLRLDIFIEKYSIAIEYQGKQHFTPINWFGGNESYNNSLKRDLEKEKLCKEHGIKLLHFTYNKNHIPKDFNYYKVITDIDELKSEISKYIDETRRV